MTHTIKPITPAARKRAIANALAAMVLRQAGIRAGDGNATISRHMQHYASQFAFRFEQFRDRYGDDEYTRAYAEATNILRTY